MRTASSPYVKKQRKASITRTQARFGFIILLVINILNYADRSILSAILPILKIDFHLSNTQLGLLASSFLFVYGITTLPLGVWSDRGVRKNIIAICVGIWSLATGLAGFTQNFIQLFFTRTILGIGEAGYAPASVSMIGDYFPKARRGRVLSLWSVGNLIGTALGLALGGIIAEKFGWRWAFFVIGLPGLIAAFLIWRAVEPERGAFDKAEDSKDSEDAETDAGHGSFSSDDKSLQGALHSIRHTVERLAHTPTYWLLVAAYICSFFIIGAATAWIPTYLYSSFHLTLAQASLLSGGVLAGSSLVGTLIGGWLADFLQSRLPQGRMIVTTIAFLVGAPLTFIALSLHSLSLFIIVFVLAIIFLSFCLGPIQAIFQDITPPDIRSTSIGLALLLGHLLGDALSPIIVGVLSDRLHSLGVALQITAPTCLLLAGLICLLAVRTVGKDMERMQQQLWHRSA